MISISSLESIITGLKTVKDINDKLKNAELSNIIADLMMNTADLKINVSNLQLENHELKQKLSEKDNHKMIFKDNMYYSEKENGENDGPFCSACYDSKKIIVRMHDRGEGHFCCPNCKRDVFTETYSPVIGFAI
mgnify:CR=1 FL=1